ncbi:MAG: COR domain-containing protein [Methylobacter sp.]
MPLSIKRLRQLQVLHFSSNQLTSIPESIGKLTQLQALHLSCNQLTSIPESIGQLTQLEWLELSGNRLNPELAAAYEQGLDAIKAYLRVKAEAQITLNEAKLLLVGEGEVGKSCLLGALRGDPWEEDRPSTHGINIKPVKITDPDNQGEITLNGWDFGGQPVYRPTHQLFFSAPAVYLVVWKPREGPQQGLVKEWIKLIKHREPEAKILVVATHGGPKQRQPDIDRQELWDLFGKDTVLDFFHVESKPDEHDKRRGIEELKQAIARIASTLPDIRRPVPKRWQDVREALLQTESAYLPLERVLELCLIQQMDDDEARLFLTISHRIGHIIHYQHDPVLCDIVVLKPDWLATAISLVLDDEKTRKENHGVVSFARLSHLWNNPACDAIFRYTPDLHPLFLRLMERFDLSYKVTLLTEAPNAIGFWQQVNNLYDRGINGYDEIANFHYTSLIAQLVPDIRPTNDLESVWPSSLLVTGDLQQEQICRIVDAQKNQSATAEGLFYQLIVRLHKYSLGREDYNKSVHWQRGLVLDDYYNGRALLEYIGNDVKITVRAPYPERFLAMLTEEVRYLIEHFWEGLRCDVMLPCISPCGKNNPGTGLFEMQRLIESKRRGYPKYPCSVCDEWQDIDCLLRNGTTSRTTTTGELLANHALLSEMRDLRRLLVSQHDKTMGRFYNLDAGQKKLLSLGDEWYTKLLQVLTDEAKEGPRLFSLAPIDRSNFNPREWTSAKFRLTLWCEHSRLPLPSLNGENSKAGVYEIELTRTWFKTAAPFLKVLTGTLGLVVPIASSGIKLALDETAYKAIEEQLDFSKEVIEASLEGSEKIGDWLVGDTETDLAHGAMVRAKGAPLRSLHAMLKAKDPTFGGLERVMNRRREFLWVHSQFQNDYLF